MNVNRAWNALLDNSALTARPVVEVGMSDQRETGGPAFPTPEHLWRPGMSLRDYFAAKAMQAFCGLVHYSDQDPELIAVCAYRQADAMLKERDK